MARGSLPSALLPAPLMDTAVLQIDGRDLSAPAAAPVSDGTAIDQGIGYILMLVALAITYFVH